MAERIQVIGCESCPLHGESSGDYCAHPLVTLDMHHSIPDWWPDDPTYRPLWCPLQSTPLVIELASQAAIDEVTP
jgi:hypothetical protein